MMIIPAQTGETEIITDAGPPLSDQRLLKSGPRERLDAKHEHPNDQGEVSMKMRSLILTSLFLLCIGACATAFAHCQMPCGIYDDHMRVKMIEEDARTIEKAMKNITELSQKSPVNYNQLVRWVLTKEEHADKIQEVVSQYFMAQRIAFNATKYNDKLSKLHQILFYAMKCKQTTDVKNVDKLRSALHAFTILYFEHPSE
jgi:nickel superoxide dismutase